MPKISVIIPVYNTGRFLKTCLDSIIKQTLKEIEIIVINDGSKDDSINILNSYSEVDDRIIILDLPNKGVSSARNSGINIAKGEFIMFVDSDDWIDIDTCEKVYNKAIGENADTIIFCYKSESLSGSIDRHLFPSNKIKFINEEVYGSLFCGVLGLTKEKLKKPESLDSLVSVWGKLYKTEIIKKNNISYMDLKFIPSECQLFNLQYLRYSFKAIYIDECLYHYRRNNTTSLTKGYREGLFDKWLFWIEYVKDFLDNNKEKKQAYDAYYSRICFSLIPLSGNLLKQRNFRITYNALKQILNHENYKEAYCKLDYTYFPIHWRIYFKFAKWRFVIGVYLMSKIMRMIINSKKR